MPRRPVTDKLRSDGAAHREAMPCAEHRQPKYLNNRTEQPPAHPPTRTDDEGLFRGVGKAQRFLSAFSGTPPHCRPHRHLLTAPDHRADTTTRFAIRDHVTGVVGTAATACPGPTPEPATP
ncbi:hypothetical protein GCM10010398_62780 [Streptomyces fimbriatus]